MRQFPKGGLLGKTAGVLEAIREMHISLHAAYAAYFIVLAVFPALLLILSLLRYTGIQVENLISLLGDLLPTALMDTVDELVYSTYLNSSAAVVGVSAVTALWSASKGVFGIVRGLNAIYGVSEDRGYFYIRSISVVYTFLFLLVLLLTLVLHVFGTTLIGMMTMVDSPVVMFLVDVLDLRFFLLLVVQSLLFTVMFMALPNKRNRFLDSLPGGMLASAGWLVFSDIFSMYVEHFPSYSNIFGSVYAIALSMLWLYCCMSIVFYGGVLNVLLSRKANVS